jgi:hypothetical protein
MRQIYNIDMEEAQRPKLLEELPPMDAVVTMGCRVECPYLPCRRHEDWGLPDPTGKSDEESLSIIQTIETKIAELAKSIRRYSLIKVLLNEIARRPPVLKNSRRSNACSARRNTGVASLPTENYYKQNKWDGSVLVPFSNSSPITRSFMG